MGVKGLKSGKGVRGGDFGARVRKGGVGKRRVEEKDVRWVMNGMVGVVKKEGREEFITGLVEGKGGWSNEEVEIVKEGVVDVDMIGGGGCDGVKSVEDMLAESDMLFEELEGKGKGVEGLERSVHATGQRKLEEIGRMFEGKNVWEEEGMRKNLKV